MTRPRFLTKIDWDKLKKQKATLLKLKEGMTVTIPEKNDINGIVHLIDAIQDYAIDTMGMAEEDILNLE